MALEFVPFDTKYYRIYVVGRGMAKRQLKLPDDWARAFNKRWLSANHSFIEKQDAIDLMEALMASGLYHSEQLAVAELGIAGNGDIVAITNYKKEVVRLDQ